MALATGMPGPAAGAHDCGGSGGVGPKAAHHCADPAYVNPIHKRSWYASRIDMGVDYVPRRRVPVVAIGDAKILGADGHSGWPGGHLMWYRLLNGNHSGAVIYVAEELRHMARPGTVVKAGHQIATALPVATGTEWGWANKHGSPRAAPCYREGMKTNSGKEMARFLRSLGAPLGDNPGRGADRPSGKRC